jgi:YidC/Oxa1 family membrane protein insertase
MAVILNAAGGALERIELNHQRFGELPQYDEVDLKGGYIGSLAATAGTEPGAQVNAVAAGTPAEKAGLKPGDLITRIGTTLVKSPKELQVELTKYEPGKEIEIQYIRAGAAAATAKVTPTKPPVSVVRPEKLGAKQDPLSLLFDLSQVDGKTPTGEDARVVNWELVSSDASKAEFRLALESGLVLHKYFELVAVKDKQGTDDPRGYELKYQLAIENPTGDAHKVVYRQDGPNGLPTEGWWYGSKISRNWSGAGIRDVVCEYLSVNSTPIYTLTSATNIAKQEQAEIQADHLPLLYAAVDSQYFTVAMTPQRKVSEAEAAEKKDPWFASFDTSRVGPVPEEKKYLKVVNTSFRLNSNELNIPAGETVRHDFQIFAGPKDRDVLALYGPQGIGGLEELVYYGWFGWVAGPMSRVLQFFHWLTGNYGIAIIMLTVLVRSCMFPISRKQAIGAQKMQLLQPEIKKIAEKYKANPEQRMKAQQELFRKHNYNPLSGCLPLFLQMPIFIGLYRSLMVNVELRQAPLVPGMEWCSNLAAPDMLWNWSAVMPDFIQSFLGPYLNVLPLVTVALFLWQQKLFMPPPTDEQSALQQKMMQYMMIFMAFMFYHVASGLCLYFIASSLWGIAERKLLPKTLPAANSGPLTIDVADGAPEPGSKAIDTIKGLFQNGKEQKNGVDDAKRRREQRNKRR